MPDTLGSMKEEVLDWLGGEYVPDTRILGAINDAIESYWESLILAALQIFVGGPVTLPLPSGAEGVTIVSVEDPLTALVLTPLASGTLPAHGAAARYTYVTESGSQTLPSPSASLSVAVNEVIVAAAPEAATGAFGWNLYTRPAAGGIYRLQNDEPIAFGTAYTEPITGFSEDTSRPTVPEENTTGDNIFYIKHFERLTTAGTYVSFNAADLDSLMMRRMSSIIATSSQYQSYAWDLINQRQLEIRPATGDMMDPRYFYIAKPRRLRYEGAPLPFPSVPQVEYYRAAALSSIFLTLHEYDAAMGWEAKADKALMRGVRALTQMNLNRNERVSPFLYS